MIRYGTELEHPPIYQVSHYWYGPVLLLPAHWSTGPAVPLNLQASLGCRLERFDSSKYPSFDVVYITRKVCIVACKAEQRKIPADSYVQQRRIWTMSRFFFQTMVPFIPTCLAMGQRSGQRGTGSSSVACVKHNKNNKNRADEKKKTNSNNNNSERDGRGSKERKTEAGEKREARCLVGHLHNGTVLQRVDERKTTKTLQKKKKKQRRIQNERDLAGEWTIHLVYTTSSIS